MNVAIVAVALLGQYHGVAPRATFKPHKYADAKAKKVATQALSAYSSIPAMEAWLNETHVWLQKPKVRVDLANKGWAFDGKLMYFKGRKVYKPKADELGALLPIVHQLRYPIDPFVTTFAEKRNYFEDFLRPGAVVKSQGKVKISGVPCQALLVNGKGFRINLLVRDRDHLLARSTVQILDNGGHVISFSDKTYRYVSVGRALPDQRFELR